MSLAQSELSGKRLHGPAVERASRDVLDHFVCEARDGVDRRLTRRELGTAPLARAVTRRLGVGAREKEATIFAPRDARWTDRPAVDPRRRDRDEEDPVER